MFAKSLFRLAALSMFALTCVVSSHIQGAESSTANTVITVGEMCGGCVKKITEHFDGAAGIVEVRCDIKSKSVTIVPTAGTTLSPLNLWESMDSIGKTPTKLVGPSGTYTSKPAQ